MYFAKKNYNLKLISDRGEKEEKQSYLVQFK